MRQNDLLCAQSPVGAEPVNAVQIGGSARDYQEPFRVVGRIAVPGYEPMHSRIGRMLYIAALGVNIRCCMPPRGRRRRRSGSTPGPCRGRRLTSSADSRRVSRCGDLSARLSR